MPPLLICTRQKIYLKELGEQSIHRGKDLSVPPARQPPTEPHKSLAGESKDPDQSGMEHLPEARIDRDWERSS